MMDTHTPAVEAIAVSKRYPAARLLKLLSRSSTPNEGYALQDVTFAVYPGEMVGLLGPNGAGKTTLLRIASTMLYPSSGSMRIAGMDVSEAAIEVRRRIGIVTSDERSFYWRLTGRENLEFFAALWDVPKALTGSRISELLERLSLSHAADRPFYSYSSGMKQKMAIARGLLANPAIVLYDEPTRALDPMSTRNIREWLRNHRLSTPGAAHVIATNQMDEAEQLCDRIIVLNRGRIVAQGTIREIRARMQEHLLHRIHFAGRLSHTPSPQPGRGLMQVTETEPGTLEIHTVKDSAGLSAALEQILAAHGEIVSCEAIHMTLEEIICSIVENDRQHMEASGAVA